MLAAQVDVVLAVAGLDVELARRLRHLLHHEVGVEHDVLPVDLLPRLGEHLDGLRQDELHADLGARSSASPRSSVATASSERISYLGILLTNIRALL